MSRGSYPLHLHTGINSPEIKGRLIPQVEVCVKRGSFDNIHGDLRLLCSELQRVLPPSCTVIWHRGLWGQTLTQQSCRDRQSPNRLPWIFSSSCSMNLNHDTSFCGWYIPWRCCGIRESRSLPGSPPILLCQGEQKVGHARTRIDSRAVRRDWHGGLVGRSRPILPPPHPRKTKDVTVLSCDQGLLQILGS